MKIEAKPKDVVSKKADSRGRITLGNEYQGMNVTVVILESEQ